MSENPSKKTLKNAEVFHVKKKSLFGSGTAFEL